MGMQRGLQAYGLAQPCKAAWECSSDGVTPTTSFEEKARKSMCEEQDCLSGIVSAMRGNWMTAKNADTVGSLCDEAATVSDGTRRALMIASKLHDKEDDKKADDAD